MKTFMDSDFLLNSETAKTLFHEYAASMPVIDYHCHVSPEEIAKDRRFENIARAWLGGDHYKWRLMRANGEKEDVITGNAPDYEKFLAFARALPKAIGNPVYHWTHLELRRYFGCTATLSPETAGEIWNICNERLADPDLSVRGIITRSDVKAIATTDDPTDSLEWHRVIAADTNFKTKVVPAFRPDKYINIEKSDFKTCLLKLGMSADVEIKTIGDLFAALERRIEYFDALGCRASDHGLDYIPYVERDADVIFKKALNDEELTEDEIEAYKTALLLFLGRQYAKRSWVMQLHFSALRNLNAKGLKRLGPDTGFDAISGRECSGCLAALLDRLERDDALPKTILYSLNPNDDAILQSIAGCFPKSGVINRVQHGGAWWFNDTKQGMESQITGLAGRGLLGGFLGMLTDSRSFLSYTRHEYFRRILCNLLGEWVENGEYPNDVKALSTLVKDISYNNTAKFFGF
ncbi:MAG: glucuronate isomerase [Clostridiales bacterium]|jgi:glucuronate isomerase|nr:glucuronate isomerase [Clostridiales bacterium]